MPHVIQTTTTVFHGAGRRFLTEWHAYRSVARARLFAEHPCDCEAGDLETHDYGQCCELHGDENLNKRVSTLARQLRKEDRTEER